MMNAVSIVAFAGFAAVAGARPVEFAPANDAVKGEVVAAWQRAADGDAVWTPRATRAQAAYDTLCSSEGAGLDAVCRGLPDQARCGLVRGLKPKAVALSKDGKTAELVVKSPGDELAVFIVREQKLGSSWRVDGVRCPASFDDHKDTRAVPPSVVGAVKSLAHASLPHIGAGWPAYAELLPPDPGVADPAWFLPDEACHVKDGGAMKPVPAGPYVVTKHGIAAVVRNNAGERYVAYFEGAHAVDARCALPLR